MGEKKDLGLRLKPEKEPARMASAKAVSLGLNERNTRTLRPEVELAWKKPISDRDHGKNHEHASFVNPALGRDSALRR